MLAVRPNQIVFKSQSRDSYTSRDSPYLQKTTDLRLALKWPEVVGRKRPAGKILAIPKLAGLTIDPETESAPSAEARGPVVCREAKYEFVQQVWAKRVRKVHDCIFRRNTQGAFSPCQTELTSKE